MVSVESRPDFNDASGCDQLWRTNGTAGGTILVTDLPRMSGYGGMTASMLAVQEGLMKQCRMTPEIAVQAMVEAG